VSNSEEYRIVRQVGNGLTGPIFLAEAASGPVAIRKFRSRAEAGSEDSSEDLKHFLRGGRQAALLHHPRIVETLEVIDEGAQAYIASEFVEAETCETVLARESLPPEQANYVLRLVAIALDYAHQNEITHGDLKPSNIFMLPMRAVKIGDFAISPRARRHAGPLPADLTHPYLSPEHLSAPQTIGPRSDQYALAAIAWRFYTGRPPSPNFRQTHDPIPTAVEAVLLRALSRDPGDRYDSCLQFVDALDAGLVAVPAAAPEKKASRLIYAAAGGLALLLLVALILSARSRIESVPTGTIRTETTRTETTGTESAKAQAAPNIPVSASKTGIPGSAATGQASYTKPKPTETGSSRELAQEKAPAQTYDTAPTVPVSTKPPVETARLSPRPESIPSSPQVAKTELVLRSRERKIEPGTNIPYRDPELGEMALGDLSAVVQTTGPAMKGKLTLEWSLDDIPMGAPQIVIPNKPMPYGNEPTPGQYKIILKLNGAALSTSTFRITR
jgi:serine/threonine-protein kinase